MKETMYCPSSRLMAKVKKIYFGDNIQNSQVRHNTVHLISTLNLNQEPIIFQVSLLKMFSWSTGYMKDGVGLGSKGMLSGVLRVPACSKVLRYSFWKKNWKFDALGCHEGASDRMRWCRSTQFSSNNDKNTPVHLWWSFNFKHTSGNLFRENCLVMVTKLTYLN